MSARKFKTSTEDKIRFSIYQEKSRQFYATMLDARKNELWAAVGLNAVHCVISLNDALTVFFLQVRSTGEDHLLAVELMARIPVGDVDAQKSNFKRIIAKKNAIAYEGRAFRQNEAEEVLKQAERFYQWGISKLPEFLLNDNLRM